MTIASDARVGLAMRFDVVVDGYDLGSWSTCKGLSVRFQHDRIRELGEHTREIYVPSRVEYPKLTLQRAMVQSDWLKTKQWLEVVAAAPWLLADDVPGAGGIPQGPTTASITLRDAHREEIASWDLENVMPSSWKGPMFDANGKAVAIESLELVHEGFLTCPSV